MQEKCNDPKCPIHGHVKVRGSFFVGRVVSAKPQKTAVVEMETIRYMRKYERYKKGKSKVYAYNPACIAAKENDIVKVGETRKLSRTKSFAVLSIEGRKEEFKGEDVLKVIEDESKKKKADKSEGEEE